METKYIGVANDVQTALLHFHSDPLQHNMSLKTVLSYRVRSYPVRSEHCGVRCEVERGYVHLPYLGGQI